MDQVRQRVALKFDEINTLVTMLSAGGFDKEYAKQLFRQNLEDAYLEGFAVGEYMLQQEEDIDDELLFYALEKEYNGESIYTKFDTYYENGDSTRLQELMEDEFHRVYAQGELDMAKNSGRAVYKTWTTMMDDRVRESHEFLEGITIPLDQKFVTLDMDEADAPGGFTLPENNCGCRCILTLSAE